MTQTVEIFEPVSENLKSALGELDTITDYHQAIMDIAYNYLKSHEDSERPGTYNVDGYRNNKPWSHSFLTGAAQSEFGELAEFAVLVGKYNQQVCNGGHLQYWDNHYASCQDITEDITLHVRLETLFDNFVDDTEDVLNLSDEDKRILYEAKRVLVGFRDQLELEPKYEAPKLIADEDGELYEFESEERSSDFGSPTEWCRERWEALDTRYYNIEEKLMPILENYFREKVKHG